MKITEARPAYVYSSVRNLLADVHKIASVAKNSTCASGKASSYERLLTIEDFRANPNYEGDGNRIDLAYSVYALAHGVTATTIAEAIRSRDLSKKGPYARQLAYASRTIKKALQLIQNQNGKPLSEIRALESWDRT